MIEAQIEQDLKAAMLARDSLRVSTLRGLKSTFLYAKVAAAKKDQPLPDDQAMSLLQKEAKKRQESADLYIKGHEEGRANQELQEKEIIESYLPAKLSEEQLSSIIDETIKANVKAALGQIIGLVKAKTAGQADGGEIARLVKLRLQP